MKLFPRQLAVFALASAIAIPVWAQDQVNTGTSSGVSGQTTTTSSDTQAQPSPTPATEQPLTPAKEGFWGRVYPFARKKWVKRQIAPINDRLSELDEVNAKNAAYIKDVDERAQAGIRKAQGAADAANQLAMAANTEAENANGAAQNASNHVNQINTTVNGLDQYHQASDLVIKFHGSSPVLTADSKASLDQLASSLTGHEGYILEIEAHSPLAGSAGIQSSERLSEAVKRYLVSEHQIPVYRMHSVALGNEVEMASTATGDQSQNQKPERVRFSSVHLSVMENSLAAQAAASPQSAPAATGAEQP
jgi:outer membrane protein OmpA-like peptidoglycan-associated protein